MQGRAASHGVRDALGARDRELGKLSALSPKEGDVRTLCWVVDTLFEDQKRLE